MQDTPTDLSQFALRPTPEEIRSTHVLFHTKHATDLTEERFKRFGYTVAYHAAILRTLRSIGLKVTPGSDPSMLFQELKFDYIYFTQIEDLFLGHELLIPCIAAFRGIAFLGPPAPLRALSEDKTLGKALASSLGVEVAKHHVINPLLPEMSEFSLPGRWILKPRNGVMSEDLTLIENEAGWREALATAAHPRRKGRELLAEEFVPGLNLTVPVIEGFPTQSFPVFVERGEPRHNILTEAGKEGQSPADYAAKPYSGPGAAEALAAAARLAEAMTPFDYARFDFRFHRERNRLVFLEVNMNCAMGPASVVARAAQMRGIDYQALISHVFTHSLRRQKGRKGAQRAGERAPAVTVRFQAS
jgi:D-alanine-D-alanine ligase